MLIFGCWLGFCIDFWLFAWFITHAHARKPSHSVGTLVHPGFKPFLGFCIDWLWLVVVGLLHTRARTETLAQCWNLGSPGIRTCNLLPWSKRSYPLGHLQRRGQRCEKDLSDSVSVNVTVSSCLYVCDELVTVQRVTLTKINL